MKVGVPNGRPASEAAAVEVAAPAAEAPAPLEASPVDALEATLRAMRADAARPRPRVPSSAIGRAAWAPRASVPPGAALAIDAAKTLIGGLERQIVRLENENLMKTREVADLVRAIEARRAEIEQAQQRKTNIGIVGALFGAPLVGVAGLVMAVSDDARLRELDASLTTARDRQGSIHRELASYTAMKMRVSAHLGALQQAEGTLARTAGFARALPGRLQPVSRALDAFVRANLLVANLEAQVALLEEIRDGAKNLGLHLDGVIVELRAAAEGARAEAEASQGELRTLVEHLLAPDPEAAAGAWITETLRARVRDAVEGAVHTLVSRQELPDPIARELERRLVEALLA